MRSTFSKSLSLCQTMMGSLPIDWRSATWTSRSQLEPGKTMTAAFMRALPSRSGQPRLRSAVQLDGIVLDHRVGEQLLAHGLDRGARLFGIALRQLELDDLALAHVVHSGEAEGGERVLDRLALGVENTALQGDVNACFHERLH